MEDIPLVADGPAAGTTDLAALERQLAEPDQPTAGVILAQPSFYGLLEPMAEAGRLAHAAGALFVAVVEPVSLAVLAPPGAYGADIAAGEGQALGIPPQYGGPYLGILACTEPLVRQIPGRLVGMTTDVDGRRAFVMTLQAREQHIRREKAASNICTNQTLLALAASVWLAALGPHGLRDVAAHGAANAAALEAALAAVGVSRVHPGAYLNEFAIRVPNAAAVHHALLGAGRAGGPRDLRRHPRRPDASPTRCSCARPRSPRATRSRPSPGSSRRSLPAPREWSRERQRTAHSSRRCSSCPSPGAAGTRSRTRHTAPSTGCPRSTGASARRASRSSTSPTSSGTT